MNRLESIKIFFSAKDMTVGKPWKNLIAFTLPMLVGSVVQQMYVTVDAIVVGRFVGDDALAAVGSTMALYNLVLVLFIGISSGAGIMVSQYYGAKKREELSRTIGACLVTLTIACLALMVAAPFGTRPLLRMLNTPEPILDWSVAYINILIFGVLGFGYYNILTGIIRGLGDSFSPLVYLVIASVLSAALDLLFVAVFGWGVVGAAVATVISTFLSGGLCLMRLFKMRDIFDINKKYLRPVKSYVIQLTRLGLPTGASQAVFSLAMIMVQSLINSFGESFMASSMIVIRIDGFVIMPIFSFGAAIMVFTGQNMGAGKYDRVRQGTRQCILMSIGTSALIVTAIVLFGGSVARLFTGTNEIAETSARILRILAAGYMSLSIGQVVWSVIRGAGDTMTPMWVLIVTIVVIRVPMSYGFVWLTERPETIYLASLISWTFSSVIGFILFKKGNWQTKGLIKDGPAAEFG